MTETSAFGRLGGDTRLRRSFNFMYDVGRLFNVGSRTGLGGTAFLGVGDGSAEVGVRGRFRYWLGARSSIDFSPGLILAHEEPGRSSGEGTGLIGQLSFSRSRIWSVAVQAYSVAYRTPVPEYPYWRSRYSVPGRDTGLMLGFKVGGKPGLIAGPAVILAEALVFDHGYQVYRQVP